MPNSSSLCNEDLITKVQDLENYFEPYIRYVVEFSHLGKGNVSKLGLGGRDPY